METWKQINGFEGLYEVSDGGLIRSRGKILLKPRPTKSGHTRIVLHGGGKKVEKTVHRIVAEAFIPNPENKPQINHKDGIPANNNAENLEWVTGRENQQHAYRIGLKTKKRGELNGMAKISNDDAGKIFALYHRSGLSQEKISQMFGIDQTTVSRIIRGKRYFAVA